ncbi:MAG: acetyltransferase [Verrucomicrobia bacterium]|nr:acetyltransferase [Verrucomicrobiota bacterium]
MKPLNEIVIFGCGGHSRSVVDVLLSFQPNTQLIFVDAAAKANEVLFGYPVLTDVDLNDRHYFFALGSNEKRRQIFQKVGTLKLISIFSPTAYISRESTIEKGVFIGNFSHVGPEVKIGTNTILNTGCIVEHEVEVGQHSHIGPRAVVSGRSKIGDNVFVGVGATIKDSVSICSDVTIGAGAVIVKNITEPGVYVGCPGKKMMT